MKKTWITITALVATLSFVGADLAIARPERPEKPEKPKIEKPEKPKIEKRG